MLEVFKKPSYLLISLIVVALFLRLPCWLNVAFTADEARVAFRASNLARHGVDELGRKLPFVFNSLKDYQLPVTSYVTALGVLIFGKTDIGVRLPFIIVGILLSVLTYKIAQTFSTKKIFWVTSSLVIMFSPVLIFLSIVPNETIILTFFITLLFYLLTREKLNFVLITFVIILTLLTSKFSWFILLPFEVFTFLFYRRTFKNNFHKWTLPIICLLLTIITLLIFLQVPQSKRSLAENNFTIFSSVSIQNGINTLRGGGLRNGWPNFLETALFNKGDFLVVGFVHWLSNLQPSFYFGQLEEASKAGFPQMVALNKILIIPFIFGVIYLIRRGNKKEKLLLMYLFILTFPAFFIYPDYRINLIVLTLPFVALIIAFGFTQFNKAVCAIIVFLMICELVFNLFYPTLNNKNTNFQMAAYWFKPISQDIYKSSAEQNIAVSDDLAEDVVSLIEWYAPINYDAGYQDVPYPYKFQQYIIRSLNHSIKIISSSNNLYPCGDNTLSMAVLSKRDKEKAEHYDIKIKKIYKDNFNRDVAYVLKQSLCIE